MLLMKVNKNKSLLLPTVGLILCDKRISTSLNTQHIFSLLFAHPGIDFPCNMSLYLHKRNTLQIEACLYRQKSTLHTPKQQILFSNVQHLIVLRLTFNHNLNNTT